MTLIHASIAIAGASAILIPIIIHLLLHRRRQPIRWGAMRFIIEAARRARRRIQLEQFILLALRCLILLLIGAALARPLLSDSPGGVAAAMGLEGGRSVYLLIDDGVASGSSHPDATGTSLDRLQSLAADIIDSLGPSDRVGLITLSRPARAVVDPPALDHVAVRRILDELRSADSPADLPSGLARLGESLAARADDPSTTFVYLLSDFLAGSADVGEALPRILSGGSSSRAGANNSSVPPIAPMHFLALPPRADSPSNIQITDLIAIRAAAVVGDGDLGGRWRATLRRVGTISDNAVSTLRLSADPLRAPDPVVIRWEPGETERSIELRLDLASAEPGEYVVSADIDRDSLDADGHRFGVMAVRRELNVAVMDRREFGRPETIETLSGGAWMRRAMDPGEGSSLVIEDIDPATFDAASLKHADAVVLARPDLVAPEGWPELRRFVDRGGLLWIMPPEDALVASWTDAATASLGLPWRWAREVVSLASSDSSSSAVQTGRALSTAPPAGRAAFLLDMLRGELPALVSAVRVMKLLPIIEGLESGSEALTLDDGTPFLVAASPPAAAGTVVYLASSPHLAWTTLPARPLMVAMVQETIRQGVAVAFSRRNLDLGAIPALAVPASTASLITPDGSALTVSTPTDSTTDKPAPNPGIADPIRRAGVYRAVDAAGRNVATLVANIDPDSARTESQSPSTVLAWLAGSAPWDWADPADIHAPLRTAASRTEMTLVVLIAAILAVALETCLARWFSHAWRTGTDSSATTVAPVVIPAVSSAGVAT